eukprot:scaffold681430_cov64-Prasinocladus_malaysianus.AAC.1
MTANCNFSVTITPLSKNSALYTSACYSYALHAQAAANSGLRLGAVTQSATLLTLRRQCLYEGAQHRTATCAVRMVPNHIRRMPIRIRPFATGLATRDCLAGANGRSAMGIILLG